MAEQHTLTVKVTGDSSQLVAALNRAQAELAQLDRQSNQTNAGFGTLGTSAGSASGALGSMSNVMAGIGWGVAISGAIAVGTELYNIGRASQVATNTFNQLQGGAEQASASLAMLQEATNFTIPDTTLMSISNLYTQMGLATDPTEVARLAEMGATLGQAMGSSAEEAMRTFSFLLSNQSIELLDTFGISSGKVRERIQDLQKANGDLARDQAFVTAVLEEGALAMERLGDATEQNISAVGKLTTRFQNFVAEIGQPIVNASEGVAQLAVNFLDARQAVDDVQNQISQLNLSELNIDGGFFGNRAGAFHLASRQIANQLTVSGSYTQTLIDLQTQLTKAHGDTAIELENQIVLLEAIIARTEALDRAQVFGGLNMEAGQEMAGLRTLPFMRYAQEQARLEAERTSQYVDSLLSHASQFRDAFASQPIITDADVANLEMIAQNATYTAETMADIIPQSSLKQVQAVASEFGKMADSALEASNYIANIDLESVLGIGLTPAQQLTSDILGRAGIGGRQAEFLTGQRTISSEMFDERVLPLIQAVGETFGEDEAAILGDRIADLMRAGIARGLENNPVDLISFIMRGAGYDLESGEGRSVVVQAGDTLSSIAAREGVTVEFLAAINKLEDPNMILTGSELVVEVGARITRVLPFTPEDEEYLTQSTLDMIYGGQPMTDENDKPITPLSPIRDDALETLATSQEIVTTLEELDPPELTPARMGLVSGDVAEVGSLEVVNMIDAKLKEISGKIYKVSMTVELDARIRTGAGFKIIPISMAEIQSDLRAASNILRTPLGQ